MMMENEKLYIETRVYDERINGSTTGKFVAVMLLFGVPVLWSAPSEDEREAMSSLRRAVRRALECSHDMQFIGHTFVEDENGISYTSAMYECKKCGYRDDLEADLPF